MRELIKQINQYFKDNDFPYLDVDSTMIDGKEYLYSHIENGDWKHDHLAIDHLVQEFFDSHPTMYIKNTFRRHYEGSEGDWYTEDHYWELGETDNKIEFEDPSSFKIMNAIEDDDTPLVFVDKRKDSYLRGGDDYGLDEYDVDDSINKENLSGRYCIVARTNDGKFKFYKDGAFIDDYKEATIFTDMDEARAEWFDIDKSKYKRVFIPNYDESHFASLNESYEPGQYGNHIFHILDQCSGDEIISFLYNYKRWSHFDDADSDINTIYHNIETFLNKDSGYGLWSDLCKYFNDKDCVYQESVIKENKEDDLYDYKTRQATGDWDRDDNDPLLNQDENNEPVNNDTDPLANINWTMYSIANREYEKKATELVRELARDGFMPNSSKHTGSKYYVICAKPHNNKGIWKAVQYSNTLEPRIIDITYDQATGREPLDDFDGLRRHLGKILLPHNEELDDDLIEAAPSNWREIRAGGDFSEVEKCVNEIINITTNNLKSYKLEPYFVGYKYKPNFLRADIHLCSVMIGNKDNITVCRTMGTWDMTDYEMNSFENDVITPQVNKAREIANTYGFKIKYFPSYSSDRGFSLCGYYIQIQIPYNVIGVSMTESKDSSNKSIRGLRESNIEGQKNSPYELNGCTYVYSPKDAKFHIIDTNTHEVIASAVDMEQLELLTKEIQKNSIN